MVSLLSGRSRYHWQNSGHSREYDDYMQSEAWRERSRSAAKVWRTVGWVSVSIPPLARYVLPHWGLVFVGLASFVSSRPIVALALCGIAYVVTLRSVAHVLHYHMRREGMHLFGYRHLTHESWWEIVPGSHRTNAMERWLRHGRRGGGPLRYFLRTVICVLMCRFWWVWASLGLASWLWGPGAVWLWIQHAANRL